MTGHLWLRAVIGFSSLFLIAILVYWTVVPYQANNPDWASVWTMRWTAVLATFAIGSFFATAWTVKVAFDSVKLTNQTERIKRTADVVSDFENPQGTFRLFNMVIAPVDLDVRAQRARVLIALADGIPVDAVHSIDPAKRPTSAIPATPREGDVNDACVRLINSLTWTATLYERNLLMNDVLLERLGPPIVTTWLVLKDYITAAEQLRLFGDLAELKRLVVAAHEYDRASAFPQAVLDGVKLDLPTTER